MKKLLFAPYLLLLVSCTFPGVPGHVSQNVSDFDGTRRVMMEPGWICKGMLCPMQLGLSWNSQITDDSVILIAAVPGNRAFADGESLHFNIDGDFVHLESIDSNSALTIDPGVKSEMVTIPPRTWRSKRYLVTREFLKRLVNGERVLVKLDLHNGYIDAVFSFDQVSHARPGFRKFLAMLEKGK